MQLPVRKIHDIESIQRGEDQVGAIGAGMGGTGIPDFDRIVSYAICMIAQGTEVRFDVGREGDNGILAIFNPDAVNLAAIGDVDIFRIRGERKVLDGNFWFIAGIRDDQRLYQDVCGVPRQILDDEASMVIGVLDKGPPAAIGGNRSSLCPAHDGGKRGPCFRGLITDEQLAGIEAIDALTIRGKTDRVFNNKPGGQFSARKSIYGVVDGNVTAIRCPERI